MKLPLKIYLSVLAFIWFGYVAGISFLEAPLKFQAPGISLPLGLGIGRIVFGALNKVELVLLSGILLISIFDKSTRLLQVVVASLCTILLLQTFWLLPFLDARAQSIIAGKISPPSRLHFLYISLEAIKLVSLLFLGLKNLQWSVLSTHKTA